MLTRTKITGVHGTSLTTQTSRYDGPTYKGGSDSLSTAVKASISFGAGSGGGRGPSVQVGGYFASQYQYMMTGLIPAEPSYTDSSNLALFYRDMYLFDNVAGMAVDIQSSFPFSRFELRGLDEDELRIYNDALEQLNISELLPTLSTAYMVDGFSANSLVFDPRAKVFQDILLQDALQCTVLPSPFFRTMPEIQVRTGASTEQFLNSDSRYVKQRLNELPAEFVRMLRSGAYTLNPANTLYIPRRSLTDRAYVSYLHRILPMYLIEKCMFRGTLVEASRRQRATSLITAGTDTWTPTGEELQAYVQQFMMAENDPLGGWIVAREGVQYQDIRPGGDFWKWTDMVDIMVPYKLRALGISESFLSGDATYASAESAYSTFLETMDAYRQHLTNVIFYGTLFPLVAVVNGLYKDPKNAVKGGDISGYLSNIANRRNLKMPEVIWHKSLEAKDESNKFDLLDKLSEQGVPVPLKMWCAAAEVDPDTLLKDLKEDTELRKRLAQYTGKDTSHDQDEHEEYDVEASRMTLSSEEARKLLERPTGLSINSGAARNRKAILSREFDPDDQVTEFTKTGKRKHVYNSTAKVKQQHENIQKIAMRIHRDPNYRQSLKKRNKEVLGSTTLNTK